MWRLDLSGSEEQSSPGGSAEDRGAGWTAASRWREVEREERGRAGVCRVFYCVLWTPHGSPPGSSNGSLDLVRDFSPWQHGYLGNEVFEISLSFSGLGLISRPPA